MIGVAASIVSTPAQAGSLNPATLPPDRSAALAGFHRWQRELPLCGFYTELGILEAYTRAHYPEDELFAWYVASGAFDVRSSGVPVGRLGDALSVKRLPVVHQRISSEPALSAVLRSGFAVMAIVDPEYIWRADDPMTDFYGDLRRRQGLPRATHVVWITDDFAGSVFINDTALEHGGGVRVPWQQFSQAWSASDYEAVVVQRLLPPLDPDGDGRPVATSYDVDGDGFRADWAGGGDCDDHDARRAPGFAEQWADKLDSDCDGVDWAQSNGAGAVSVDRVIPAIEDVIAGCLSADEVDFDYMRRKHWTVTLTAPTSTIPSLWLAHETIRCELTTIPIPIPLFCELSGVDVECGSALRPAIP